LVLTIKAIHEKEDRHNRFLAAIQGVDLESSNKDEQSDVTTLKGWQAKEAGFGIGVGLGYVEE
jgi:hypothetical protein